MKRKLIYFVFALIACCLETMISCSKFALKPNVPDAAYLRIFNDLYYTIDINNRDKIQPFLTFFFDPQFDRNGLVTGAIITGDFLDKRTPFGPPVPSHAVNTGVVANVEYPGSNIVLTAPNINGFDLSSWAQIPSGTHRIAFYSRPMSAVPFLSLDTFNRKSKIIDTTITFSKGGVYTLEVINPDAKSSRTTAYVRQENFTTTPFSDNHVYANFYNITSVGDTDIRGFSDTMNVYVTTFSPDTIITLSELQQNHNPLPMQHDDSLVTTAFRTSVVRTIMPSNASYLDLFALFPSGQNTDSGLNKAEIIDFYSPGYSPQQPPGFTGRNHQAVVCSKSYINLNSIIDVPTFGGFGNGDDVEFPADPGNLPNYRDIIRYVEPNLIINTPSGKSPDKSFSSVNTFELIGNRIYLIQLQRSYSPPTYK